MRRAEAGAPVLLLTQQLFGNPVGSGLVPLSSLPLASSILVETKRGIPSATKPRGAELVLYRVLPPGAASDAAAAAPGGGRMLSLLQEASSQTGPETE